MYDSDTDLPLLKLPIGIQAFETLRGQGYLYVDKTRWVHRLVTQGMFYFLARPRRFGKSLLVSTLKCLFEGRRELFEGLWIAQPGCWEWQPHPVVVLDFNQITQTIWGRGSLDWQWRGPTAPSCGTFMAS